MRRGVSGFARFRAGVLPLAAFLVALLVPLFVTQRSDAAQKPGIAAICTQYGSMTASSERFAAEKLTAAHRTLPLGTLVRVTNVHNGHSVVVRINDRGPSNKERINAALRKAAGK